MNVKHYNISIVINFVAYIFDIDVNYNHVFIPSAVVMIFHARVLLFQFSIELEQFRNNLNITI